MTGKQEILYVEFLTSEESVSAADFTSVDVILALPDDEPESFFPILKYNTMPAIRTIAAITAMISHFIRITTIFV